MERVIANEKKAAQQIQELEKEFEDLKAELIAKETAELQAENRALLRELEWAKMELSALEHLSGRKTVRVPAPGEGPLHLRAQKFMPENCAAAPSDSTGVSFEKVDPVPVVEEKKPVVVAAAQPPAPQKEKKPKVEKPKQPVADEPPVDIRRLDLRVGNIVEVSRHPDADGLYVEKIDVGEAAPRTIISGLVKHVPIEEMQNRMVIVLCNLKPAKMRGILSEGMVMCASSPEKVEVLAPPSGAVPGDFVHVDGYPREPDTQMNPKKKIFETVAPDLLTNDALEACYKGVKWLIPGKGPVLAQTLKNVNVK